MRINNRGSAILLVTLFLVLGSLMGFMFLSKSAVNLSLSGIIGDSMSSTYQMEAGFSQTRAKLDRAISTTINTGIQLNGKLALLTGDSDIEDYIPLVDTYTAGANDDAKKANAMLFLRQMIQAQSITGAGTYNTSHEFYCFDGVGCPNGSTPAFPTTWTDPNPSDNEYWQIKYTFNPLVPVQDLNPARVTFEYEYRVEVRAYGKEKFTESALENSGLITITVEGAPFSRWAIFRDKTKNQNGSNLHFVGNSIPEVFWGRVHTNNTPYFFGAPVFQQLFTSAAAYASWYFGTSSASGYVGSPVFNASPGYQAGVSSISMPSTVFNTVRMASGDPAANAPYNNTAPTNSELRSFLAVHASGTMSGGSSAPSDGIYIPINSAAAKVPTGGIYVQGNAAVTLNVVSGSGDFSAQEWNNIAVAHRGCKFQKIVVDHASGGVPTRNIYIGDDPCNVTYYFNGDSLSTAPAVLNGRVNGNIHASGSFTSLGGQSRTRPAIATDFAFTVSAIKDVIITNDLQYEDVQYVSLDGSLNPTSTVVANAWGPVGGSGIEPTTLSISAQVPEDSKTVLGIISSNRNVLLHTSIGSNPNIHAAIYAGNGSAYSSSTGLGCGSSGSDTQGCGFGYQGWDSALNKGGLKLFGSISEFKNQTVGVASSPPTGFTKRYSFDSRLANNLTPPGFPISSNALARGVIQPLKTLRLSKVD